jgi:PAS domain S-box-containing protein
MKLLTYWKNLSVKKKLVIVLLSVPIILSLTQLINTAKHVVEGRNKPNVVLAERVADNVLDKIDRNFYERFGDVQAFAYNKLAEKGSLKSIQLLGDDNSKEIKTVNYTDVQDFINTMVSYYVLYDVMMICDKKGNVQFINTKDKNGNTIYSSGLVGRNFASEPWFNACMSSVGPEGGAWYSDFMISPIAKEIYHSNGYGMGFAAPIKNEKGEILGVWYNFANWMEVTQSIRIEAQGHLKELSKDSKLMITNSQNQVIDGEDDDLIRNKYVINESEINQGNSVFQIQGDKATIDNALLVWDKSEGAFTFKGKGWKAVIIIPKERLTFGTFFSKDLIGIIVIILIMMAIAIVFSLIFSMSITKRIDKTNSVLQKLGKGELVKMNDIEHSNDEIGQIIQSVDELSENLSKTANFSKSIGEGDLEANFEPLGEKDVLGNSLITMRANLKQVKEDEAKRNWVVEGLAKFTIFTRDTSDEEKFYNVILSNLIRYIHANQGYLYVINDENPEDVHMEVKAVYAYGKQRYLEEKQIIKYKQGLVGQAWFDKEPLYFTEIPTDYVNITSGMGEATPTSIFIVPLKVNDEVYGALEIASFEELSSEKVEFINKLSETIASTISTVKMNERTKLLLMQSQQQAENLRSQEEEIRQNMEEMQATSAEMQRVQRQMAIEKQRLEDEFMAQSQIINTVAIVSKTDVQGNITYVNDEFCKWAKYSREEVMGKNHRILRHPDMPAEAFDDLWKTISSGKIWRGEVKNLAKDGSFYWVDAIIAPVLDKSGKPKEYIAQRFVINEKKALEEKVKALEGNK